MQLCPECGSPWSGTLSCPECAKRRAHLNQTWKCANCGKENRAERNHCWSCASPKDSPAETPSASRNLGSSVAAGISAPSEPSTSRCTACGNDIEHGRGHAWNCTKAAVRG